MDTVIVCKVLVVHMEYSGLKACSTPGLKVSYRLCVLGSQLIPAVRKQYRERANLSAGNECMLPAPNLEAPRISLGLLAVLLITRCREILENHWCTHASWIAEATSSASSGAPQCISTRCVFSRWRPSHCVPRTPTTRHTGVSHT